MSQSTPQQPAANRPDAPAGILSGVRVLDFGRYIAGPYCATLLAEYGAEVIRIDKRDGSEDRFVAPLWPEGQGALFMQVARNKKSLTLDPMTEEGREVMRRLVRTADVVIANLPTPTLKAMGLDYESLSAIKPDIILTTVSTFGSQGPLSADVGFDGIGQAMSGTLYMGGMPEQPYRAAVAWVDFSTALHCAVGTLVALMERARSGRGQQVSGTLLGSALALNNAALMEQAVTGIGRVASGNRAQTAGPSDVYRTRDGWLLCQVLGNPLFARWAKLVGEPDWIKDPRFATDEQRGLNGELLSERMSLWCAERSTAEAQAQLAAARIPCGPVLSPQQVLDHPQVAAMEVFENVDFPGLPRPAPVARVPLKMSVTEGGIRRRAPLAGEHSDEVLAEIGYDPAAIAALRERGIV